MAIATKTATPSNARAEVRSDSGVQGILNAFKNGGDLDAASEDADLDADIDSSDPNQVVDDDDPSIVHSGRRGDADREDAEGDEDDAEETEDEGEKSSDESEASEEEEDGSSKQAKGDAEKFWVTDAKGRREVAVDWQDKRTRQRLVGAAYGYHHERQQRADIAKQFDAYKAETAPVAQNWAKLDAAWQKEGFAGLVPLLTGGKQTMKDLVAAARAEEDRVAKMSPAEQMAHMEKLARERSDRELAEIRAERDAAKKATQDAADAAEAKAMESAMETTFMRGRLKGGDAAETHKQNEVIWDAFKARINRLPDDAVVTEALLEQTLAEITGTLGGGAARAGTAAAKKKIEKTKTAAGKAAQTFAKERAPGRRTATQSVEDAYDQGGVRGVMSRFLGGRSR